MATFYGVVKGGRGRATRTGTTGSGLDTYAASWNGAVHTRLYMSPGLRPRARVTLEPWLARGTEPGPGLTGSTSRTRVLYDGPVDEAEPDWTA